MGRAPAVVGARIQHLCKSHAMSYAELSRRAKISTWSLERYIEGTYMPYVATLIRIADVFKVSMDYMVGRRTPGDQTQEQYVSGTAMQDIAFSRRGQPENWLRDFKISI